MMLTNLIPRLPVADLERTLAFYQGVLGFQIEVLWPDDTPSFAVLTRENATVGFFLSDGHRSRGIGDAELYIEVVDARALHASVQPRVPIEWGPEVYPYGRLEFAIRDPDFYLLIFSEPVERP